MRALLAAGLVLGTGAAVTLATWTDNEYGTTTFTAGTFGIVGSTDGSTFGDHASTGAAATLSFTVASGSGSTGAMTPGTTVYALYSVKTIPGSVAGTLQLIAGTPTGTLGPYLSYGVATISGTTCNATSYGQGTVVMSGSSIAAGTAASTQNLSAAGGNQLNYCFMITMPSTTSNAAQGLTVAETWQFSASAT